MNKKDLIQMIKQKASEVEIKDLSSEIVEKAKHLPHREVFETKRRFSLKPAFLVSALTFAGLLVMFFILSPNQPSVYAFESLDQAVADATIASLGILSETDELIADGTTNLSMTTLDIDNYASLEIDSLIKYLGATERLLGTSEITKTQNQQGYQVVLNFNSTDILGEVYTYQVRYNLTAQEQEEYKQIEGIIDYADESYPFEGQVYFRETSQLSLQIQTESSDTLEIIYQDDDQKAYRFNYYQNDSITQSVLMRKTSINNQNMMMIDFKEGSAKGSYMLSKVRVGDLTQLRATYLIPGAQEEIGTIDFNVSGENYQIEIRPNGKDATIIERGRMTNPPMPPHGGGNPHM